MDIFGDNKLCSESDSEAMMAMNVDAVDKDCECILNCVSYLVTHIGLLFV